jgi:hypothetical protein
MTTALQPADELPLQECPSLPNWTENYLFHGYDHHNDHGVWLHLGSPVFDFGLWQDISMIYLPGGEEMLLSKGFAPKNPVVSGPSGSQLSARFDPTSNAWVVQFRGAARRVRVSDLGLGLPPDGPEEPLAFELRYHGLSPVWDLSPAMGKQSWGNAHWEQPCSVSGQIEYEGRYVNFQGAGIRDHSRGSRDFSALAMHKWMHGQFPGGRGFGLIHIQSDADVGAILSRGYLIEDERIEDVAVESVPDGTELAGLFTVILRRDNGERVEVTGELIHDAPLTIGYPNDLQFGRDTRRPGLSVFEGQTRWTWAGSTGYGLAERSARI